MHRTRVRLPRMAAAVVAGLLVLAPVARAAADGETRLYRRVTVVSGDTLWNIARTGDGDPRSAVKAILEANPGIEPGALVPGSVILVPT